MTMHNIEILAFKGCLPALTLYNSLLELLEQDPSRFTVRLDIVPAPRQAKKMGMHGSPTILVNQREYQIKRRGPASFY
ncbi:MAG: hypothetical protein KKE73_03480 [Proteobacteria bacterium]|nr:hypothetical protein [Pseudomonadota bacterium]